MRDLQTFAIVARETTSQKEYRIVGTLKAYDRDMAWSLASEYTGYADISIIELHRAVRAGYRFAWDEDNQ